MLVAAVLSCCCFSISEAKQAMHYALGLISELGEAYNVVFIHTHNKKEQSKELGDYLWYFSQLCYLYKIEPYTEDTLSKVQEYCYTKHCLGFESITNRALFNYGLLLSKTSELTDYIKKVYCFEYNLNLNILQSLIGECFIIYNNLLSSLDLRIEFVTTENIDKLMKRYPEGFSTERAINRND